MGLGLGFRKKVIVDKTVSEFRIDFEGFFSLLQQTPLTQLSHKPYIDIIFKNITRDFVCFISDEKRYKMYKKRYVQLRLVFLFFFCSPFIHFLSPTPSVPIKKCWGLKFVLTAMVASLTPYAPHHYTWAESQTHNLTKYPPLSLHPFRPHVSVLRYPRLPQQSRVSNWPLTLAKPCIGSKSETQCIVGYGGCHQDCPSLLLILWRVR